MGVGEIDYRLKAGSKKSAKNDIFLEKKCLSFVIFGEFLLYLYKAIKNWKSKV